MATMRTWLDDLIEVYNELGGTASYRDVYPLARKLRLSRGATWTPQAEASIRRTVEDHAKSSKNFRGKSVFYSVNGHGKGVWALMPAYIYVNQNAKIESSGLYATGLEGIVFEVSYLRKSRDPSLVELRKEKDNYTCQACGFRLDSGGGKFVIDVHHLNPLGAEDGVVITTIDDLICLCPTCHRIAHAGIDEPIPLDGIRRLRYGNANQTP